MSDNDSIQAEFDTLRLLLLNGPGRSLSPGNAHFIDNFVTLGDLRTIILGKADNKAKRIRPEDRKKALKGSFGYLNDHDKDKAFFALYLLYRYMQSPTEVMYPEMEPKNIPVISAVDRLTARVFSKILTEQAKIPKEQKSDFDRAFGKLAEDGLALYKQKKGPKRSNIVLLSAIREPKEPR